MFFQDGLLLLNEEVVVAEILELAALKISGILKVPPEAVKYGLEQEDEKVVPFFQVDAEQTKGLKESEVREVMGTVYDRLRIDLSIRRRSMMERRRDYSEA